MGLIPTGQAGALLQWYDTGSGLALRNRTMDDLIDEIASTAPTANKYFFDISGADIAALLNAVVGHGSAAGLGVSAGAAVALSAVQGVGSIGAIAASAGAATAVGLTAASGVGEAAPLTVAAGAGSSLAAAAGAGTAAALTVSTSAGAPTAGAYRFWFHDAAATAPGTLPSGNPSALGTTTVNLVATGASTNRLADLTRGSGTEVDAQTPTLTTNVFQTVFMRRFVTPPLVAGCSVTIGASGAIGIGAALSPNVNTGKRVQPIPWRVYAWDPVAGALRQEIYNGWCHNAGGTGYLGDGFGYGAQHFSAWKTGYNPAEYPTANALLGTLGGTGGTYNFVAGDVLVFEVALRTGGTGTNPASFFYDGPTDPSTVGNNVVITSGVQMGAFFEFANAAIGF